MVRTAVVFALALAAEAVRHNVDLGAQAVEANLDTEAANVEMDDSDFDYEAADALDFDADLEAGDFNFEESAAKTDFESAWTACPTGRVKTAFNRGCATVLSDNQRGRCQLRYDDGRTEEMHAMHLEHHPSCPQVQVSIGYGNQGYGNQGYGNQGHGIQGAGNFMVADGCRRSQGSRNPEMRSALGGFASVRCCSNNGRRCESTSIGCLQHQTLTQATAACSRRNMRLCSVQELDSGVCCGTGCGFDGHFVWTMSPAGGAMLGQNGHGVYQPVGMQNGQFGGQHGFSGSTFNGGGFNNQVSSFVIADGCQRNQGRQAARTRDAFTGRAAVRCCSLNGRQCQSQTVGCLEGVSFNHATTACSSRGLRLCSQQELDRGVCCGTGCGFDGRRVWSNTPAR